MISEVRPVSYRSHDATYRLDVEVLTAQELRTRVVSDPQRGFERIDFQCYVFVRSGSYSHVVDFETYELHAGACLLIGARPGAPIRTDERLGRLDADRRNASRS